MTRKRETSPLRPIAPGDVVVVYSDELAEWTAAQITDLDPVWRTAGVLELDWSGPEPFSVDDLGALLPLTLAHHSHGGRLSHRNYEWLLPRSYRVLGNAPLVHDRKSNSYSVGWRLGDQLSLQRRWDRGERSSVHHGERSFLGVEIAGLVARSESLTEVRRARITEIDALDCDVLVGLMPNLTHLSLSGNLGTLSGAASLNRLRKLKTLTMSNLFGMSGSDCLSILKVPNLEMLALHSVPAEYAAAMKKAWAAEAANGTFVEITNPRKPDWVTENRDNPLRDWDGRENISASQYRKSVNQYKATRRAVLEALAAHGDEEHGQRIAELGKQFGAAFNRLDGTADPFIDTVERDELFAALDAIIDHAEAMYGRTFDTARQHLIAGTESVRDR